MSLGATIRRPDREPLGNEAYVKAKLSAAFPDVRYTYVAQPGPVRLPLPLRLLMRRPHYPHWYGLVQMDRYAAEFTFDASPVVPSMRVELYGPGTKNVEPRFAQLTASTGWEVVYDE